MKNHFFKRFLLVIFTVLALSVFTQPTDAKADAIDDMAWVLNKMGPANPFAQYGITGDNLISFKGLFNCIEQGNDVIVCTSNFKDTPLGQTIDEKADIPSWFWDLVDVYIAFKNSDFWGVISNLGQAVVCIVAQVLAYSFDVCGLIQDLINLAKDVYNTAKAVIEFIADLGEAVWGAIESAACAIGLGGCDDPAPPPPPIEIIYGLYFAPHIASGDGLKKIEAKYGDQALSNFIQTQKNQASATHKFSQSDINSAAYRFGTDVDKQWSAHISNTSNGPLVKQKLDRSKYNSDEQLLAQNAQKAWNEYLKNGKHPEETIASTCNDYFKYTLAYEHIDRWILKHKDDADKFKATTNYGWCKYSYLSDNQYKLSKIFKQNIVGKCQLSGDNLLCPSPVNFKLCFDMLKPFGLEKSCLATPNATVMAAKAIEADFRKKGSKTNFNIVPPDKAGGQAKFVNPRPKHQNACKYTNDLLHSYTADLLVKCIFYPDPGYIKLINQVKQIVDTQNKAYPPGGWLTLMKDTDPLFIRTFGNPLPPQMNADLHKSFGFNSPSISSGFMFNDIREKDIPFDGLDTPTISTRFRDPDTSKINNMGRIDPVKEKIGNINPGNPNPAEKQVGGNFVSGQNPQTGKGAVAAPALSGAKTGATKATIPAQKAPAKQGY